MAVGPLRERLTKAATGFALRLRLPVFRAGAVPPVAREQHQRAGAEVRHRRASRARSAQLSSLSRAGSRRLATTSARARWSCFAPARRRTGEKCGCKASSSSCTRTCGVRCSAGCAAWHTRASVSACCSRAPSQPADSLEIYKDDEYIIGDRDLLVNRRVCAAGKHGRDISRVASRAASSASRET